MAGVWFDHRLADRLRDEAPSAYKDIGRVIALLRSQGEMAILLVEQYFDFARDLAQTIVVMDRGDIVLSGRREELDEGDVRRRLSV